MQSNALCRFAQVTQPAFQKQLIILAASIFECLGVLKDTKNKEPKLQVTLHNLGLSFSVLSSDVT